MLRTDLNALSALCPALCIVVFATFFMLSSRAAETAALDKMDVDIHDQASLQRGVALYMNYCMGCHALGFARYERTARDLGIPLDIAEQNFIFDDSGIGDLMSNAMPPDKAKEWFGLVPPDLSLVGRLRGGDWLYTYLRSFYSDPDKPLGVNNRVFPDVGMPHVLLELQGLNRCAPGPVLAANGGVKRDPITGEDLLEDPCGRFENVIAGRLSEAEYDGAIKDLVNFLVYVGEPAAKVRYRIGGYVMLFLGIFLVFAWLLKREYWKEVH